MPDETAQFGWCKLAELVGKSPRACMRRKAALKSVGAIHYTMKRNSVGKMYKAMFFFPSVVKAFMVRTTLEDREF